MNLTKRIISIILFCCFLQSTFAQLKSEQASSKLATQYSKYDTIYTFNAGISPSSIRFFATAPDSVNSTFEWSRFDTTAKVFNTAHTENGIITSSYTLPNTGGYRVHIFNGSGLDTTFTFWTFIDSLRVELDKNVDGTVNIFTYVTCDFIEFKILSVKWNKLRTFDPLTGQGYSFPNKISKYEWETDPQIGSPYRRPDGKWRTYEHPFEDTWYSLFVTDSLGAQTSDKVRMTAVKPKAKFSIAKSNDKESSPLKIWLNNESSSNATEFIWYTQSRFPGQDTIYRREPIDSLLYLEPGKYKITLIAKNSWCVDSVSDSLKVALPNLSIPNFFTPGNNDGSNDFFVLDKAISVVNYKITIFSRNGKKVYEKSGETLMNWEGWNGRMNGNGEDATPGIYYYVLEVKTYEKRPTIPWVYKGFVYLFRKGE